MRLSWLIKELVVRVKKLLSGDAIVIYINILVLDIGKAIGLYPSISRDSARFVLDAIPSYLASLDLVSRHRYVGVRLLRSMNRDSF
ncbi:MAG: hypothetical protein GXO32_06355 [Crenarchaeota archaeon]|nr:hypothetical protein [Thermoproteota archaeon]